MTDLYPDGLDAITDPADTDGMLVWDEAASKLKIITVANARTEMQQGIVAPTTYTAPPLQTITSGYRYMFQPGQGTVHNWGVSGITANLLYYEPWPTPLLADITVSNIGIRVTTAAVGATFRLGIAELDDSLTPLDLTLDAGTVSAATTGWKEITGLSTVLSKGKLYAPMFITTTAAVQLARSEWGMLGMDSTATNVVRLLWKASAAAQHTALSDPPPTPDTTDLGNHAGFMRHVMVRWT